MPETACNPRRPEYFHVERIVLAKGSNSSTKNICFVEDICRLYPNTEIIDHTNIPHNRIDLQENSPASRLDRGKRTLVFGEHKSAVRFSEEEGNTCPNYWHFSPYGFCFYGCKYCYLSGTKGVWHSPTVKIFLNLDEILDAIDKTACRTGKPIAFYLGKLQDGLALDILTGYSQILIPFFANHKFARQVILTKSGEVSQLLDLDHRGRTILSWSVNPPEIASRFEANVPPIESRLRAMKLCAGKGYPVRAVIMPVIPVDGWEKAYADFTRKLLSEVPIERLTIGGICIYRNAKELMETKLGRGNDISKNIDKSGFAGDGRARYPRDLRIKIYCRIIEAARETRPETELALCLEEYQVWKALGIEKSIGSCNCVL